MSNWWFFSLFLVVPILVHLFDFRKAKKIYFSSLKFISNLSTKTRSKSRLKYFLILSNRIAIFIMLLLLIWAIFNEADQTKTGPVAIYLDNSLSAYELSGVGVEEVLSPFIDNNQVPVALFNNSDKLLVDRLNDERLPLFDRSSLENDAVHQSLERLEQSNADHLYVFSDFQNLDLDVLGSYPFDTLKHYHFIQWNNLNELPNISVDSLWLQPNPNDFNEVTVLVDFNVANITTGNSVIKIMQGSRQLSSVVKEAASLDKLQFDIPIGASGLYHLLIDGDGVEFDNTFYFTIDARARPQVVLVSEGSNKALEAVFENDQLFSTSRMELAQLDYAALEAADLIVFNGFLELPSNLLNQFPGKGLVLFPQDSSHSDSYSALTNLSFERSNIEDHVEIDFDRSHPLLKGIFEEQYSPEGLPAFSQIFNVGGEYESVMSYRNGQPFLLKQDELYFFNTPLSANGGFESNALFLPLLYQIAFSASSVLDVPYYFPGDVLAVKSVASEAPVKLRSDELELIPPFSSNGTALVVEIPRTIRTGVYELVYNEEVIKSIAVNQPKEESNMVAPHPEELKTFTSKYSNLETNQASENLNMLINGETSNMSLWKYALILTTLLMLSESMLHRYIK